MHTPLYETVISINNIIGCKEVEIRYSENI